jgi:hypothetical protein
MKRSGWLKRTEWRPKPKAEPPELTRGREAVKRRSGGLCEAETPVCEGIGHHAHHVKVRGMGGSKATDHSEANLLWVSSECHRYIHANVAWSKEQGYLA